MPPKNRTSKACKSGWISCQDWKVVTLRKSPVKPVVQKPRPTPPKYDKNGDWKETLTHVSNKESSKIIRARNSMGLTQLEFAHRCGVNVSEITRIERGDALRVPQTMSKIFNYIDKNIS